MFNDTNVTSYFQVIILRNKSFPVSDDSNLNNNLRIYICTKIYVDIHTVFCLSLKSLKEHFCRVYSVRISPNREFYMQNIFIQRILKDKTK